MDVQRDDSRVAPGALAASVRARDGKSRRVSGALCLALTVILIASGKASAEVTRSSDGQATTSPAPQCSDLTDNDGDGLIDLADPDCSGPLDTSEDGADGPDGSGGSGDSSGSGAGGTPGGDNAASTGKKTAAKKPGLIGKQNKKGQGAKQIAKGEKQKIEQPTLRNPDGSPAPTNPGLTVAQFGPAPIGVPNFVIDSFEIPPFLLPIYQSCGTEYGIPWQVLASINKIETAFGTNLNVSSAGAEGWMQFIPSTWAAYGVDANGDGKKDPYNPVDAICAAARYLRAAGGDQNIRQAILAYNHADWYADEVLLGANQYGKLPDALVGSLTGLTEGAHFPVAADARYADDGRRSTTIYSRLNAPIVAINDGVIKEIGENAKLGKYIVLQDAYGNQYTYTQLGSIAKVHAVLRESDRSSKASEAPTSGAQLNPLKAGSKVSGGTVIGRVGTTDSQSPHLNFAIRPAGRGTPTIDSKSILDGWKLLETTSSYRTADTNSSTDTATVGQVLLMSKAELERRVLNDPALSIYSCGRNDIQTGQIDRRVLAVMEYLVAKGYRLTITSLKCGHSYMTSSGNVSAHSYGSAVDIAAVNGTPISGHQGRGSITEAVITDLLRLQGTSRPAQIISLMDLGGPSFSLADHNDHIHVGYSFTTGGSKQLGQTLNPEQWQRLTRRLGEIQNPKVSEKASAASLPATGDRKTSD
jgi:hypothetical protein